MSRQPFYGVPNMTIPETRREALLSPAFVR